MANNLKVSEMFYSIQGEGRYAGTPAVFLRMKSCNLLCDWCDTIEVWKKGEPYNYEELIKLWDKNGWLDKLISEKSHLVITGGEPLLQQKKLENFLEYLGENVFVEIETNCTKIPTEKFDKYIKQYNVSPKLANSRMPENKRYKPEVIKWFSIKENADFKFVIVNREDVNELIREFVNRYQIINYHVYLMPESTTKKELEMRSSLVIEASNEYGFNYSPRLQLSIWDEVTGI